MLIEPTSAFRWEMSNKLTPKIGWVANPATAKEWISLFMHEACLKTGASEAVRTQRPKQTTARLATGFKWSGLIQSKRFSLYSDFISPVRK
jgi:hypothetical protein